MTGDEITLMGVKETWVDRLLHRLLGRPPTLEQRIATAMEAEQALVEATRASINRQAFDLHMSLSRIKALEDWNHGIVRKDLS